MHPHFLLTRSFGLLKKSTKQRNCGSVTTRFLFDAVHRRPDLCLQGAFAVQGVQGATDKIWKSALELNSILHTLFIGAPK
jgi:hypothetical protein